MGQCHSSLISLGHCFWCNGLQRCFRWVCMNGSCRELSWYHKTLHLLTKTNHRLQEEVALVCLRSSQITGPTSNIIRDTSSTVDLCERLLSAMPLLPSCIWPVTSVGLGSWPWLYHLLPGFSRCLYRGLAMCEYSILEPAFCTLKQRLRFQPLSAQGKHITSWNRVSDLRTLLQPWCSSELMLLLAGKRPYSLLFCWVSSAW